MNLKYFLILTGVIILTSCEHVIDTPPATDLDLALFEQLESVSETGSVDHFILPAADDYINIPQDPKNPLNGPKRTLGQYLFHETGIGLEAAKSEGMETYSCASCHIASAGFRPGRFQGIADGGIGFGENGEGRELNPLYDPNEIDAQGARPLSVLNVAFVENTFWNGQFGSGGVNEGTEHLWDDIEDTKVNYKGFSGIESQNFEGMHLHRMTMNDQLVDELGYRSLFDLSFPEIPEQERYTTETASLAISAYLRSLMTDKAPFQEYLKGDYEAMSDAEKEGAMLFFGKAGCVRCHNNTNLGSVTFHAIGVKDLHERGAFRTGPDDRRNLGRGGFTGKAEDLYAFKVPQLYNLKDTPFYFHGSSKESIREVVEYFNAAIPENNWIPGSYISPLFTPLYLSEEEVDKLVLFLENSLRDPHLERYTPPNIHSGNCFPNNDAASRSDMGCE